MNSSNANYVCGVKWLEVSTGLCGRGTRQE